MRSQGFEEGRHHDDLSYPNILQIENRLVHLEKNRPMSRTHLPLRAQ